MVDGYQVLNADGTHRQGGGAAAAPPGCPSSPSCSGPATATGCSYGDPDVAALVHDDATRAG